MKNLIKKLSETSEFFNENRFVFQRRRPRPLRTIESAQKEQGKDVSRMSRGEVYDAYNEITSRGYLKKANKICRRSKQACNMLRKRDREILKREKAFRAKGDFGESLTAKDSKSEIARLLKEDAQVPGYQKFFDSLRYKIADAGLRKVTDKEVDAYIRKWERENPGNKVTTPRAQVRKILQYNRREKAAKEVGNFLKRNRRYLDRVIVSLYVHLVKFKERDKAQEVVTGVKNKVMKNRRLMAYLPGLKKPPIVVAGKGGRRRPQ